MFAVAAVVAIAIGSIAAIALPAGLHVFGTCCAGVPETHRLVPDVSCQPLRGSQVGHIWNVMDAGVLESIVRLKMGRR